jgi:DNA polymerase/3'-5' exonuclease PolX
MQAKPRYPRATALAVVRELLPVLQPCCSRIVVAGSLRRGRREVGDAEILFIPRLEVRQIDLVTRAPVDLAVEAIEGLLASGVLAKRPGEDGITRWGKQNKLAVHVASGLPVDLFAATEENWFNYLVCRTGPKESNRRIAEKAKSAGWTWNPYKSGFTDDANGRVMPMGSEQEVFEFVGLPYREPRDRG